jgi:triosephosphate isomerase
MTPHFVANWKMNKTPSDSQAFASKFIELLVTGEKPDAYFGIAPTATTLPSAIEHFGHSDLKIGAQNVHWEESGAHTGEISAPMLVDLGASFAIVGHSERRQFYGESDESVALRAKAAIKHGLTAIVCVGELEAEFKAGNSEKIVASQLEASLSSIDTSDLGKLIVAYEPVWAIGTGLAATPEIASNIHDLIRAIMVERFGNTANDTVLLYGGSTKPGNIAELCAQSNINGALIGGAALMPESFYELICNGAAAHKV